MKAFNRGTEPRLSPTLECLLGPQCEPDSRNSFQELSLAVSTLSRFFTTDRTALPDNYLDNPLLAAAYWAYFMPVNLEKVQSLLDELPDGSGPEIDSSKPMTVLDFGGGPGSGALACMDWIVTSERPDIRVGTGSGQQSEELRKMRRCRSFVLSEIYQSEKWKHAISRFRASRSTPSTAL